MDDLKALQQELGGGQTGGAQAGALQVGAVHEVLDRGRVVVRLPSGALRKVYCADAPPVGAEVLVRGDQLVSLAGALRRKTLFVP